jgi:hypothetical protein
LKSFRYGMRLALKAALKSTPMTIAARLSNRPPVGDADLQIIADGRESGSSTQPSDSSRVSSSET